MAQITEAAIRYRIRALEGTIRSMEHEMAHPESGGNRPSDYSALKAKRQELSVLFSKLEVAKTSSIKPAREHYHGQQREGSDSRLSMKEFNDKWAPARNQKLAPYTSAIKFNGKRSIESFSRQPTTLDVKARQLKLFAADNPAGYEQYMLLAKHEKSATSVEEKTDLSTRRRNLLIS